MRYAFAFKQNEETQVAEATGDTKEEKYSPDREREWQEKEKQWQAEVETQLKKKDIETVEAKKEIEHLKKELKKHRQQNDYGGEQNQKHAQSRDAKNIDVTEEGKPSPDHEREWQEKLKAKEIEIIEVKEQIELLKEELQKQKSCKQYPHDNDLKERTDTEDLHLQDAIFESKSVGSFPAGEAEANELEEPDATQKDKNFDEVDNEMQEMQEKLVQEQQRNEELQASYTTLLEDFDRLKELYGQRNEHDGNETKNDKASMLVRSFVGTVKQDMVVRKKIQEIYVKVLTVL